MDLKYALAYVKMCYGRAYTWVNIPVSIFSNFSLLILLLKAYNIPVHWTLIAAPIAFILIVLMGHLDMKWKFYELETKIANANNPELMRLVKESENR